LSSFLKEHFDGVAFSYDKNKEALIVFPEMVGHRVSNPAGIEERMFDAQSLAPEARLSP
jgi:hypothetical protein